MLGENVPEIALTRLYGALQAILRTLESFKDRSAMN